jgi:hypothetical protein
VHLLVCIPPPNWNLITLLSGGLMLLTRSKFLLLDALTEPLRPHAQAAHLVIRTARHRTSQCSGATPLPAPPPLSNLATSKDVAAARDWFNRFRGCPIPRAAVDIAFSRSSGPGGQVCPPSSNACDYIIFRACDNEQNVNKVNTKVTIRCALDSAWIPSWARDGLQQSVCHINCSVSISFFPKTLIDKCSLILSNHHVPF